MPRGVFITIEGGEGAGKSTQVQRLAEALKMRGKKVLTTREPGGSIGAEEIRALLLKGSADKWDKITEALLFMAARRDHLVKTVWPAMAEGYIVLCDRFMDSTLAYQGYGYGRDEAFIAALRQLYHIIAGEFQPDLTVILDIAPEVGLRRSLDRIGNTEQRFEHMDLTFHQNLRRAFLSFAEEEPARYAVLPADQSIEALEADILRVLDERGLC